MAENSGIEWTDHTVNLWWGCSKVHAGCKNCYAEVLANRFGGRIWGEKVGRKLIKSAFKDLDKYQRRAEKQGIKYKIFCGSMMDIFEDSKPLNNPQGKYKETDDLRQELFERIEAGHYKNLIFLFLTKRPENIETYVLEKWNIISVPKNVWFGISISDQKTTDEYLPKFIKYVGGKKFLSVEPQIGVVNILKHVKNKNGTIPYFSPISWIIQGGESGAGKRPFDLFWAESLKSQCKEAGIPYFFKQIDKIKEIPERLKIREFPKF